MSGHSKWSTIKRKKGAADAKRGKMFTKHIREITFAAREGGGDPEANPRLRNAILAAKSVNMPQDNIKKAIQRGTGEIPGQTFEEVTFEGYGPGGVALFVEAVTDNRNRTLPEIRHLFDKTGGKLGNDGCVAWMFERKGYVVIEAAGIDEETLLEVVLDAGGQDLNVDGDNYEVYTSPEAYGAVLKALEEKEIAIASQELSMIPSSTIRVEGRPAQQLLKMLDILEDHDDVQNVYANFDIDPAEMEKFSQG